MALMEMRNQVFCGDCLELLPRVPSKSVDLILCDLPYGTTAARWDIIIPFAPLWAQYERIITDNGAILLTASQPFTSALVMSNPRLFRYELIWQKDQGTGHLNAKKMPLKNHESILVFYKKQPVYNPQFTEGAPYSGMSGRVKGDGETVYGEAKGYFANNTGTRYPVSIRKFNKERGLHGTQKPVALMEYLIRQYSNPGHLVLDNCAGSGTTGVAALRAGRDFILMEKMPQKSGGYHPEN